MKVGITCCRGVSYNNWYTLGKMRQNAKKAVERAEKLKEKAEARKAQATPAEELVRAVLRYQRTERFKVTLATLARLCVCACEL